jgi:hypothetical protein
LQARGEFKRVSEDDMIILAKAAIAASNVAPNLGTVLLFSFPLGTQSSSNTRGHHLRSYCNRSRS